MKQEAAQARVSPNAIEAWLISYISKRCDIPAAELDLGTPFEEFGIDSVQAVEVTAELENEFKIPVEPTALFEFNTIGLLVTHIASSSRSAAAP